MFNICKSSGHVIATFNSDKVPKLFHSNLFCTWRRVFIKKIWQALRKLNVKKKRYLFFVIIILIMRVAVYRTLSPVTQTSWNISLPCGQRKKGTSQCTLTALWQYINAPDGLLNQHIFPLLLLFFFWLFEFCWKIIRKIVRSTMES